MFAIIIHSFGSDTASSRAVLSPCVLTVSMPLTDRPRYLTSLILKTISPRSLYLQSPARAGAIAQALPIQPGDHCASTAECFGHDNAPQSWPFSTSLLSHDSNSRSGLDLTGYSSADGFSTITWLTAIWLYKHLQW